MVIQKGVFPANRAEAESIAISALQAIAADTGLLNRFLGLTGIDPGSLREAAAEPGFLGAVTGFVMGDEATLLAFAANAGIAPEAVARAHAMLSTPFEDAPIA